MAARLRPPGHRAADKNVMIPTEPIGSLPRPPALIAAVERVESDDPRLDSLYEVMTASTTDEALALVEARKPDVLVTDIGMPESDGFELLRRVRALGPDRGGRVPAIALTAFARSEDRTRALRAGFLVHVSKPVDPSELIATVASVAGRVDDQS